MNVEVSIDRSPSSSSASTADEEGLSVIRVDSSEAGLVLGRGGATKRKIENAADVDIELVTTGKGREGVYATLTVSLDYTVAYASTALNYSLYP